MLRIKTGITTSRIRNLLPVGMLSLLLYACDPSMVYDTWNTIPDNSWNKDSISVFHPVITDTVNPVNLVLGVRNTNDYPYSNMWLFVTTQTPSGLSRKDTFEVVLASSYGKWYGSGWGNTYTSLHYYKRNVILNESGEYTISLQHGMRKDELKGVNAVGFRIEELKAD
ncbi:gliding motility lipoprotein GldH [Saccharicrinis sp. FJH54]|uniref:gliding motility lipoprotein GldH n=1 Tax=Saccharicrinis sp. FJH54 TaxID=3344665 RepID=UPI0035D3E030